MTVGESLADWVYRNRKLLGLTQMQLAARLGVSQGAVAQWEQGNAYPQAASIVRLEAAFTSDYVTGEDMNEDEVDQSAPYGEWVTEARTTKGLSVLDLAEASGVTPATIYNIESGRIQNPQQATKDGISHVLGLATPADVQSEINEQFSAGKFGQLHDFNPHSPDAPSVAGVYVLYDISGRPVYVGISENISRRMSQHRGADHWFGSRKIVDTGMYIPLETIDDRRSLEALLIGFLGTNAILNHSLRRKQK